MFRIGMGTRAGRGIEGEVLAVGRVFLPAVGLALFLLTGCRFGEPVGSTATPPPPSPRAGGAASAGGGEPDAGDPGAGIAPVRLLSDAELALVAAVERRGGVEEAAATLLSIPVDAPEEILVQGEAEAAALADEMDVATLRDFVAIAARHPRLLPPFQVELALRRYLAGDRAESGDLARAALALGARGETAGMAEAILADRLGERVALAGSLGVILSPTGSPALSTLSLEIREGIELALALEDGGDAVPVRLVSADDAGVVAGVAPAMTTLNGAGVAGLLGPIFDPLVEEAAERRGGAIPILSPTARLLPADAAETGVLSLTGVDPAAGRALADLVASQGIGEVVLLHPAYQEMFEEARWFQEAFSQRGGSVRRTLTYPPETTGFREVLSQVAALAPRGLVILLPMGGGDIDRLAPQITFYGIDTIPDLVRFGNEGWTTPSALNGVEPRHTDGVLAISRSLRAGELGPGWESFRTAYETHFRRSLRSSAPAFGYDAARLLLQAVRDGGGTPQGTLAALRAVREFPGATGTITIVEGRVERRYYPVRIQNRLLFSP